MKKYLYDYCVGCGLCHAMSKAELESDEKGFLHPKSGDEEWLMQTCPAAGKHVQWLESHAIWGRAKGAYVGWSSDESIRTQASSGGCLTGLCIYLLESKTVDAVLHTCADDRIPYKTKMCISKTKEEVIAACGSRYAISHPLMELQNLDLSLKYAFVGKPCDVAALRNYLAMNQLANEAFVCLLSFFCAGLPSEDAQKKLLASLDCEDCISLKYRGNGWPGYATAIDHDGKSHQMSYDDSWGKILGRDIMKMCRYCIDGIGETADIACGDFWYITDDNKPDFSEHNGRNILFSRTEFGEEIIKAAIEVGYLKAEQIKSYEHELSIVQKYQYERRATMLAKLLALHMMMRSAPKYPLSTCREYAKKTSFSNNLRIFWGTIKRVVKRKI